MKPGRRIAIFLIVVLVSIAGAVGYAGLVAWRARAAAARAATPAVTAITSLPPAVPTAPAAPAKVPPALIEAPARTQEAPVPPLVATPVPPAAPRPYIMFRSTALGDQYGQVSLHYLDSRPEVRLATPLQCDRVHFAAGRGICLEARRGVLTTYHAHVFDRDFAVVHSVALAGPPSRARMSPDGRLAAMTVFVSGHAYGSPGFTTRTSVLDAVSGEWLAEDLEKFSVTADDVPVKATDFNFWGVTFTKDSRGFYATLGTGGKTFLVKADLAARRMRIVHDDVECPSLSPDNTRIAFKRRIPAGGPGRFLWQLQVLELASGRETALVAETRDVDDQVEWLNNTEVLYSLQAEAPDSAASTNVWALSTTGTAPPRLLVPLGFSPAVVR